MSDNKNMKEKISALADGELSDFETRRILAEISSNPQYRDFWRSIQQTKFLLEESDAEFLDSDISEQLYSKLGKRIPVKKEQLNKPSLSKFQFYAASFVGFFGVIIYSIIPQSTETFSDFASQKINQAIASPQAMEVLNNSVSGMNVTLQDFESNNLGTLANYRIINSGETFKVSLYPIQEINKMGINEAAKISYIKSKTGVYVVSVSGNISTDKKNQILQKANFFAEKLK
tara:strand:- start:1481 stop:2173 length:693 start_codon:yes stop_codon:yes gene_type:complete